MRLAVNVPVLQGYMQRQGWDERQLAANMGVTYTTVYRVIRGKRAPGNEFIARLLKACPGLGFEKLFIFESILPKGNKSTAQ